MFWSAFLVFTLLAQIETYQANSRATLISEKSHLVAGQKSWVGLWIQLEPDWHTYWENPGDSASASIFEWTVPEGVKVSRAKYPTPKRFKIGPLYSFGYENEVVIPFEIDVSKKFKNKTIELQLDAEWLVCKEECIPAFFTFKKELAVSNLAKKSPNSDKIEVFRKQLVPETTPLSVEFEQMGAHWTFQLPELQKAKIADIFPFPNSPLSNDPPSFSSGLSLKVKMKTREVSQYATTPKVLAINQDGSSTVFQLVKPQSSLLTMLLFAFFGGLILNLMPCVFPILFLKFYSTIHHRDHFFSHLVYSFGVVCSFWVLAAIISSAKLGWGFQMQSPEFLVLLSLLLFLMSLNFLGIFEIDFGISGVGQKLTQQQGPIGSFFTGVLAVVVASPCTAPFMGTAIGYALTRSTFEIYSIFTFLGLGLAFPYMLFGLFPSLGHWLPKPGPWMDRFKQFLAFPLFATIIWLLWVFTLQTDASQMAYVLTLMLLLGFAVWAKFIGWQQLSLATFLCTFLATAAMVVNLDHQSEAQVGVTDSFWQSFSSEKLAELTPSQAVFVNFTAAWCISCQVNEQVTFRDSKVRQYVKEHNIVMLKADWTKRDDSLGQVLKKYGRAGVPLYLYFPKGNSDPKILPEILTPQIWFDNIKMEQ